MKLKSYAQHGEDCLIWTYFGKKKTGLIIEVGAFDGKYLSNSFALERVGWRSICIEPLPTYFELLKKNRPNSINVNAAIVGSEDIRKVVITEDLFGVFSSVKKVDDRLVQNVAASRGIAYKANKDVIVPATTLNSMLDHFKIAGDAIDCLSIDVEGGELDVLQGLDLNKYRPELLVIEANNEESLRVLTTYLAQWNYFLARKVSVNYFFVTNEEAAQKIQSIEVKCKAAILRHPKGWLYSEQSNYLPQYLGLTFFHIMKTVGRIRRFYKSPMFYLKKIIR